MSKKSRNSALQLRGTVLAYNLNPKGQIVGATVDTPAGLAQLNFPKHAAERMARGMTVGSAIDLAVQVEHDRGDHIVYVLTDDDDHADGTIIRLNYSLHGELNGCHLDDGTFVHLKPAKAKRYELRLGTRIRATGTRRTGADAPVLDAWAVNESAERSRKPRARG
jgi:hypothetical protein